MTNQVIDSITQATAAEAAGQVTENLTNVSQTSVGDTQGNDAQARWDAEQAAGQMFTDEQWEAHKAGQAGQQTPEQQEAQQSVEQAMESAESEHGLDFTDQATLEQTYSENFTEVSLVSGDVSVPNEIAEACTEAGVNLKQVIAQWQSEDGVSDAIWNKLVSALGEDKVNQLADMGNKWADTSYSLTPAQQEAVAQGGVSLKPQSAELLAKVNLTEADVQQGISREQYQTAIMTLGSSTTNMTMLDQLRALGMQNGL